MLTTAILTQLLLSSLVLARPSLTPEQRAQGEANIATLEATIARVDELMGAESHPLAKRQELVAAPAAVMAPVQDPEIGNLLAQLDTVEKQAAVDAANPNPVPVTEKELQESVDSSMEAFNEVADLTESLLLTFEKTPNLINTLNTIVVDVPNTSGVAPAPPATDASTTVAAVPIPADPNVANPAVLSPLASSVAPVAYVPSATVGVPVASASIGGSTWTPGATGVPAVPIAAPVIAKRGLERRGQLKKRFWGNLGNFLLGVTKSIAVTAIGALGDALNAPRPAT